MRREFTLVLCVVAVLAHSSIAGEPSAKTLTAQIVEAAGGEDKLLKLFRIQEQIYIGSDPDGVGKQREAVMELPDTWWQIEGKGARDRGKNGQQEPARFLAWAWTLRVLLDPDSKLEPLAAKPQGDEPAYGLRVSGSIDPPMEMYFDGKHRLLRIDWKGQYTRLSDYRQFDGLTYPAKIVGFRSKGDRQWYISRVVSLERLERLPPELQK